jgi:hypothetical protein
VGLTGCQRDARSFRGGEARPGHGCPGCDYRSAVGGRILQTLRLKRRAGRADAPGMESRFQFQRPPPMSNAERQRQFRERHPGYYAAIQRSRRGTKRYHEARLARLLEATAASTVDPASTITPLTGSVRVRRAGRPDIPLACC